MYGIVVLHESAGVKQIISKGRRDTDSVEVERDNLGETVEDNRCIIVHRGILDIVL